MRRPADASHVEAKEDHISVLDKVLTAFDEEQALLPHSGLTGQAVEVRELHNLSPDEASFKVAVDRPCSLWGWSPPLHGPRMTLFWTNWDNEYTYNKVDEE